MKTLRYCSIFSLLLISIQVFSQREHLDLNESTKAYLEEQAIKRVEKFQEYCSIIANKDVDNSKRLRTINWAMKLFVSDKSTIKITNFDGTSQKPKRIETYLKNLMNLNYKYVDITSYDFHLSTELTPSTLMRTKYPGEDWYEGTVSVIQRFTAGRFEYEVIDVVERTFQVYMRKIKFYQGNREVTTFQVKIGDIEGRTISTEIIR